MMMTSITNHLRRPVVIFLLFGITRLVDTRCLGFVDSDAAMDGRFMEIISTMSCARTVTACRRYGVVVRSVIVLWCTDCPTYL